MSLPRNDSGIRGRRGGAILIIGLMFFSMSIRSAAAQDRAANWLEDRGMFELLQLHLEEARVNAAGDAGLRDRLATRPTDDATD